MSEKELTELIEKIKLRRLERGLSYQELSDLTGINKSTLQRYETGFIKKVPINQVQIIAKALNVTPGYLMGWENNKENQTYYSRSTKYGRFFFFFISISTGVTIYFWLKKRKFL